ncbi:MAG: alpha/beta hydrolase [Spirochaetes bacterium]|nr:alpha/beta hydrolase [Spirochaetota bacterium]
MKKAIRSIAMCCMAFTLAGCASMGAISISPDELKKKYGTAEDRYLRLTATPGEIAKRYGNSIDPLLIQKGLDITVRYRDEGQGQPVLLLHGVCASLETWDGWVRRMKGRFRIIRIDIPGFGMTGPAPDKRYYRKEIAVDFVDLLMDRLGIRQFSIVGNSLGGYIAWNYALKYPHKIKKMILIDSVGYNQKLPALLSFASSPAIQSIARSMMPRSMLNSAVKQVYGDKSKVTPEIQQRYFDFAMREGNKAAYVDVFAEMVRMNNVPGLSSDIPNIRVPVMVMWGTKDEWIPYTWVESWKKDLPSAKFISYEGAGHIPMEEIPDRSSQDAMKFLR